MSDWQSRIIGLKKYPVHQLLANPFNPRRHPAAQRDAIRGSLNALGIVAPPIQNVRTGHILDGHLRIEEYLTQNEDAEIDVLDVDLSEDEEKLFIASFDYITTLANYDRATLDTLLQQVNTDDAALQSLLSELAAEHTSYFDTNTAPGISATQYTDDDIASGSQALADSNMLKAKETEPAMCPHCGTKFYVASS